MFIFPSPHSQNIQELATLFKQLDPHCSGYHIDIMDGSFVPKTMGSVELTNQIAQLTTKRLWVHLMVNNPLEFMSQLKLRSQDIVSVHYQTLDGKFEQFIAQAKKQQLQPSLAISPDISTKEIFPLCRLFEHILIMSVQPGAAGQKFLNNTLLKIETLVACRAGQEISLTIAVDGGINLKNIQKVFGSGASNVAVTTAIFDTPDPVKALEALKSVIL